MKSWLTRTILLLSVVSLLNDMASELLYPIIPLYLAQIGYGVIWIGILEGFAEAVAGLSKGWFGEWSDKRGERLPFVRLGYMLSALAKPFLPLVQSVYWALLMRISDRMGKGIRTGARDALLASESSVSNRGRVFGFHRSMDTLGAVLGPLMAMLWLISNPGENYAEIFWLALIPGGLSLILLFLIREKKEHPADKSTRPSGIFVSFGYWKKATPEYRQLTAVLTAFMLFNSSDMFLLLILKQSFPDGITIINGSSNYHFSEDIFVVMMYILFNVVYTLASYPAGVLSDKFGSRNMMITGIFFFSVTYGLVAYSSSIPQAGLSLYIAAFMIYGLFYAFTEGIAKSWISLICAKEDKGVALGLYSGLTSIALLIASVGAGFLWNFFGSTAVFTLSAIAGTFVLIYMAFQFKSKPVS